MVPLTIVGTLAHSPVVFWALQSPPRSSISIEIPRFQKEIVEPALILQRHIPLPTSDTLPAIELEESFALVKNLCETRPSF